MIRKIQELRGSEFSQVRVVDSETPKHAVASGLPKPSRMSDNSFSVSPSRKLKSFKYIEKDLETSAHLRLEAIRR